MKRILVTVAVLAALGMLAGGCTKKVTLSITNHSDMTRDIQVTTPEETLTLGQVGPNGGKITHPIRIKTEEFPAQVRLSAEGGAHVSFTVTDDTKDKLYFHISGEGAMSGPHTKDDVYVETVKDADVTVKSGGRMVVR